MFDYTPTKCAGTLISIMRTLLTIKVKVMNLFYDPSIIGLRQLVDTADKSLTTHNLVVDYDGEVIIDPEKKFNGINLSRFKFHTQIPKSVVSDVRGLKRLFETLFSAYHSNTHRIDIIRRLRNVA
jgi:hypothetical protein